MRVLHLLDTLDFAGTERHVLALARASRMLGVDVRLACPRTSALAGRAVRAGLEVIDIPAGGDVRFRAARKIRRMLSQGEVDVVHAHNGRSALAAAVALCAAGRGKGVMTQHFLAPAHLARRGLTARGARVAHRWVNRTMHRSIAISASVRTAMIDRGDVAADRIDLVPNGIDDVEPGEVASAKQVRSALSIGPETALLVCVSRLEPEKDVRSLLSAMATVARVRPDVVCAVAGQGSQKDDLLEFSRGLGLNGAIRFLGFRADALSLIGACDVFVLPSIAEPFGLVLLEAMSAGKPVIAMAAGGPLEIVEHGSTGLLVAPSDPGALAESIEQLLADPDRRGAMGNAGRRRFQEHYTADRMAREVIEVYNRCRPVP
jgi:glycosyltransferase involved in cell wall biosynthesis